MQIVTEHLTKVYGRSVYALNGVDLQIPTGMFGLLGPNGAGKTTLMRILAGILHPSAGAVRIGDNDATTARGQAAVRRVLGYLPQEFGVYPDLRAREFLDYIAILKGLREANMRRERVAALLEVVGLTQVADRQLKTFSGGMRRRVGIAQALLNDPQLLIVDEPTSGLDPEERIRFRNLLSDLAGERTVLLSTHIVEDVGQTCERLAVLVAGRVLFQGTVPQLIKDARGHVWQITMSDGAKPAGDLTFLSTLRQDGATQYRAVGVPAAGQQAEPAEPGLEEGYVWLMRQQRAVAA